MSTIEDFFEEFPSDTARGREVQDRIVASMESRGFSLRQVFGVRLALEEALVNAIKHGNKMDLEKVVRVNWQVSDDHIRVRIEDQGVGFNIAAVPDPTDDENLDKPGGRGIMLMRSFMSLIEYNDKGNVLTMEMRRTSGEDE